MNHKISINFDHENVGDAERSVLLRKISIPKELSGEDAIYAMLISLLHVSEVFLQTVTVEQAQSRSYQTAKKIHDLARYLALEDEIKLTRQAQ